MTPLNESIRSRRTVFSVVTAVVGGIVLLLSVSGWVFGAPLAPASLVNSDAHHDDSGDAHDYEPLLTQAVAEVDRVSVESERTQLSVVFGDVTEAELRNNSNGLAVGDMWIDENTLHVEVAGSHHDLTALSGCEGACFELVLPKPRGADPFDLDFEVTAGSADIHGDFGDITGQLQAGQLTLAGSARSAKLNGSAGSLAADLRGVEEFAFEIQAADAKFNLSGVQPRQVTAKVNAGDAQVTLPRGEYALAVEAGLGDFTTDVQHVADAASTIGGEVSLGSFTVTQAQ